MNGKKERDERMESGKRKEITKMEKEKRKIRGRGVRK